RHRCQDNPYCDEIDEDYNAAAHIRSLALSHSSVIVPIRKGKLELGKYQQVAIFEFDGRDGKGKNPIRTRTVQIWISPSENLTII
ncbi:MAG: YjbQ family protein, partial [Patescibacteria group bacterium]|nr:YjbQ family protein [Patescibacteria group bacterium]